MLYFYILCKLKVHFIVPLLLSVCWAALQEGKYRFPFICKHNVFSVSYIQN